MGFKDYKPEGLGGVLVKSISITIEDWRWIQKNNYSLSRVLRKAINDLKNKRDSENVEEMSRKISRFIDMNKEFVNFIENKGLIDEFHDEQKKKDQAVKHKDKK